MKYTGTSTRARISHAICVLYHDDPLPTVYNNNINRKELYDFYYTPITLTTGPIGLHGRRTRPKPIHSFVRNSTGSKWTAHTHLTLLRVNFAR